MKSCDIKPKVEVTTQEGKIKTVRDILGVQLNKSARTHMNDLPSAITLGSSGGRKSSTASSLWAIVSQSVRREELIYLDFIIVRYSMMNFAFVCCKLCEL